MKNLKDILYKVALEQVAGNTDMEVSALVTDSRKAGKGCVFVAQKGTKFDSHDFIAQVIEQGTTAIVCEEMPKDSPENITFLKVKNARKAVGIMASNFYDNPSEKLKLLGVTGTNGKTTTTTLLYQLFKKMGYKVGLISTIRNLIGDKEIQATHTTPDPVSLNQLLAEMVEAECGYVFMEVSSHAIHQDRIAGLKFEGGVFTNITHDHLDYHVTFLEYINAKKKFFDDLPATAFSLVNTDDKRGLVMVQNTKAKQYSYGIKSIADFHLRILENSFEGMVVEVEGNEVHTKMVGRFNAYNFLAVYGTAVLLGFDKIEVLSVLSLLQGAEGRFDYVKSGQKNIVGVVDYAHTPDALKNVLSTINDVRTGNEILFTVVGCGGNRDKEKRPKMAMIAAELSDKVILTSDNPRDEEPKDILEQMRVGVPGQHAKKVLVVEDRREAIRIACSMCNPGDIILLAGKGHEKYQEIKGIKNPFDDKEILANTFKEFGL